MAVGTVPGLRFGPLAISQKIWLAWMEKKVAKPNKCRQRLLLDPGHQRWAWGPARASVQREGYEVG
ncbi:hypothetical protein BDDG_03329 [Blastomyces dermatitidis ATCC 18188]|uniref:Uncharacterized protein n=1 Tax=Ajellomyces dermatitidis (strain ATCC 18188 / CBS 674.68) TaxID=653446 RepID=F2TAX5_AJEDA|nr:hypothetical protein BDDG_03329 [Blastomyces dermatitidis ATCC 18188]